MHAVQTSLIILIVLSAHIVEAELFSSFTQTKKPKKTVVNCIQCEYASDECGIEGTSTVNDCADKLVNTIKMNSIELEDTEAGNANTAGRRLLQAEQDELCVDGMQQEGAPWGLDRINQRNLPLDGIYSYNATGKGINVYLISTGIRATHNDFKYRDGTPGTRVKAAYSFDGSDPLVDRQGFGTQSASIIGGLNYGVAKDVIIYSVKVFNLQASTNVTEVFKAIEWVANNAQKPAIAVWLTYGETDPLKEEGVKKLLEQNIPVVVGAGNQGLDACGEGPANVPEAITVAGSAQNDALNPTSNFGPCVNIIAPGGSVRGAAAFFDSGIIDDTNSNTAPAHVAGALAQLMEKYPNKTPQEYTDLLYDAATVDIIQDPKGANNRLLFTGQKVQRCKKFDNLSAGERDFKIDMAPVQCVKPNEFPDMEDTQSSLIYLTFNVSFSNKLDELDPTTFVVSAGDKSVQALSVKQINPRNSCGGYQVFAAIEQPTAFTEDSSDVCVNVDGSKIKDPCGATFPDYQSCVRFESCPEAQICAFGMSYSPATTTNDARTVSQDNILMASFSSPVSDFTKDKIRVLGPYNYEVEILAGEDENDAASNVKLIKVTTPDDFEGPVTVQIVNVHDQDGQITSPIKPITYDVKTAIAGVRKDAPKNKTKAMDRGMGDPNHVCNCGAAMFGLDL
eukprot:TRINITY_DN7360_c0_g1_i4.p1 TRINITY_DN7360_c0_g1~~TRINITY_DN7360_c0_g1_i4.p1  ORF type:complete len:677 (+),score=78.89 TRINITY_DN7360_c0_g1_i4:261-2291(+)